MDNLDDLKALWHTAKTDRLPNSKEMLQLIRSFRNQKLRNKWLVIAASLLFSFLIIVILVFVDFKLITTYLGGGLMSISGFLVAATNFRSLKRFNQLDDCSNLNFLAFIEQTRQNQLYYYNKTMVRVLLLCSVGWFLYLYEPLYNQPLWLIAILYTIALTYLSVMWFIVRPRSLKKDADKLDAVRKRLNDISKQLK
jgi:hypothetical protein